MAKDWQDFHEEEQELRLKYQKENAALTAKLAEADESREAGWRQRNNAVARVQVLEKLALRQQDLLCAFYAMHAEGVFALPDKHYSSITRTAALIADGDALLPDVRKQMCKERGGQMHLKLELEIHNFWECKPTVGDHIVLAHPCTTYAGVVTSVTDFSVAFHAYHREHDRINLEPGKGAWWARLPYHDAFRAAGCGPVGQDRLAPVTQEDSCE